MGEIGTKDRGWICLKTVGINISFKVIFLEKKWRKDIFNRIMFSFLRNNLWKGKIPRKSRTSIFVPKMPNVRPSFTPYQHPKSVFS